MKQENFNTRKNSLTENDIAEIVDIIGKGCRQTTKNKLKSILTYMPSSIRSFGILDRLMFNYYGKNEWHYCAGQSYTDEIKTIRELILK